MILKFTTILRRYVVHLTFVLWVLHYQIVIYYSDLLLQILVWQNPFVVQGRADKRQWIGYENTNMDALDSQVY